MWDGNVVNIHVNNVVFVEREPMWDDRSGCEWCVVSSEW